MDVSYNLRVVKYFIIAAFVWAIIGMCFGVLMASQLYFPEMNFNSEYTQFGRIRPVHTNILIFGFVCNLMMGTSLYVVQRTGQVCLFSNRMAWGVFWCWQLVIVSMMVTLPMGFTTTKEYAEAEWPIDIVFALTWVIYGILFFATLAQRKHPHIFVSNWFFGAVIIVIGMVFIINNLEIPVLFFKSYSIYAGAEDATMQWWWGHNAVGFLLTASFIGMNYYFFSKIGNAPIYSYGLSVLNFWGIVGFYTWAGTHHLIYSAVPYWVQNLGIVMSLLLWIPSWAGAYNLARTVTGSPNFRKDYLLWFCFSSVIFYALATFEGPLLAIRAVNLIGHNTDWIIGHVHTGTLGWMVLSACATFYYLIPKLFGRSNLWSIRLLKWHFWMAHIGIALYAISMWVAGIGEGIMWLSQESSGALTYSFLDVVKYYHPWMFVRLVGGGIFLLGMLLMAYNLYRTVTSPKTQQVMDPGGASEHA